MKRTLFAIIALLFVQMAVAQFNPWTIKNNRIYPKDPNWKLSDSSFTHTPSDSSYIVAQIALKLALADSSTKWLSRWIFVRDSAYRAAQEAAIRADSSNQVRAYQLWDKHGSWLQIQKGSQLFFAKNDTSASGIDTTSGPFAGDVPDGSGLLRGDDYERFWLALQPADTTGFNAGATASGFLLYSDWWIFAHKPDTNDASWYASRTATGFLNYLDFDRFASAIDTLNSKISGVVSALAGDSVTVGISGITWANSVVIVSYAEKVTTSDAPPGWAINNTDTLTLYGTTGKRISYFLAKK